MRKESKKHIKFAVLATDVVLFTIHEDRLKVLLIDVNRPPHYMHQWGLPGGLIDPKETAEEAAQRHLRDKARATKEQVYLEQLYTFSALERDLRGRVVSVAYFALVPATKVDMEPQAKDVKWEVASRARNLAYDHDEILKVALDRLKAKLEYTNIAYGLMPRQFTLSELQHLYELIRGEKLDKRNFRRKVLSLGLVELVKGQMKVGAHRPAQLYRFVHRTPKVVEVL